MTDRDQVVRTRLASAALVLAGLLAIALLLQERPDGNGWTPAPVELGEGPVLSISCDWAEDVEPFRRQTNLIGVLETTVRLDTTAIFDDPRVDFDPEHLWLNVSVYEGARSRDHEQRVSPHELVGGPPTQEVTIRFDVVYDPNFPGSPPCRAVVAVS